MLGFTSPGRGRPAPSASAQPRQEELVADVSLCASKPLAIGFRSLLPAVCHIKEEAWGLAGSRGPTFPGLGYMDVLSGYKGPWATGVGAGYW